jgi:hypothetical protein
MNNRSRIAWFLLLSASLVACSKKDQETSPITSAQASNTAAAPTMTAADTTSPTPPTPTPVPVPAAAHTDAGRAADAAIAEAGSTDAGKQTTTTPLGIPPGLVPTGIAIPTGLPSSFPFPVPPKASK